MFKKAVFLLVCFSLLSIPIKANSNSLVNQAGSELRKSALFRYSSELATIATIYLLVSDIRDETIEDTTIMIGLTAPLLSTMSTYHMNSAGKSLAENDSLRAVGSDLSKYSKLNYCSHGLYFGGLLVMSLGILEENPEMALVGSALSSLSVIPSFVAPYYIGSAGNHLKSVSDSTTLQFNDAGNNFKKFRSLTYGGWLISTVGFFIAASGSSSTVGYARTGIPVILLGAAISRLGAPMNIVFAGNKLMRVKLIEW